MAENVFSPEDLKQFDEYYSADAQKPANSNAPVFSPDELKEFDNYYAGANTSLKPLSKTDTTPGLVADPATGAIPLHTNTPGDIARTAAIETATGVPGAIGDFANFVDKKFIHPYLGSGLYLLGLRSENPDEPTGDSTVFPSSDTINKTVQQAAANNGYPNLLVQPQTQHEAYRLAEEEGAMGFGVFGLKNLGESIIKNVSEGTGVVLSKEGLTNAVAQAVKGNGLDTPITAGGVAKEALSVPVQATKFLGKTALDVGGTVAPGAVGGDVAQSNAENGDSPVWNALKTIGATVLTHGGIGAVNTTLGAAGKATSTLGSGVADIAKNIPLAIKAAKGDAEAQTKVAEYKVKRELDALGTLPETKGELASKPKSATGFEAGGITTGDIANDTALKRKIQEVANKYPGVSDELIARTKDYAGNLHDRLTGAFDTELNKFQTKYNVDLNNPEASGNLSVDAKKELGSIKDASNGVVNKLFDEDRIDPNGKAKFNITPLQDAVDEIRDSKTKFSKDAIPTVSDIISPKASGESTVEEPFSVNKALGISTPEAPTELPQVGYKELKDLQSNLKNGLSDAQAANGGKGNRPLIASYTKLINAADDTIGNHEITDTGVAGRYNEAVQARSAFGKRFEQGAMGQTFAKLKYGEPKLNPSTTLDRFVGQKALEPMGQFKDVVQHAKDLGLDTSSETVKKMAAYRAYSEFRDANGAIDVNKLINSDKNNPRLLDEVYGTGFTKELQPVAEAYKDTSERLSTGKYEYKDLPAKDESLKKQALTLMSAMFQAKVGRVSGRYAVGAKLPGFVNFVMDKLSGSQLTNVYNRMIFDREYASSLMNDKTITQAISSTKDKSLKEILGNDAAIGAFTSENAPTKPRKGN